MLATLYKTLIYPYDIFKKNSDRQVIFISKKRFLIKNDKYQKNGIQKQPYK